MDYLNASVGPANMELLHGCCREAQQADFVAFGLQGLQSSLSEPLRPMMVTLLEEIRRSGRLLRDLADKAQLHVSRVPVMLNYLNIIMPCFSKSLKDITSYYENKAISRENRWRKMYHEMGKEASNLPLPQRFMLYNHFLDQLGHLLARSPDFDPNTLELLQTQILKLRDKRGIPPPAAQSSLVVIPPTSLVLPYTPERPIHWAEDIFSRPLASRTPFKHLKPSETFRPFSAVGELHMPRNLQTLFKRPFDNDRISVTVFLDTSDNSAYLFARSLHFGTPWFSLKGAHELCISREGAALVLKRWSASMQRSTPWAVLYFLTWEEMVLFHCAFVALKRNSARSFDLHPDEFRLEGERRLFQARINDDGYEHSLIVYRDAETRGLRLHAAVWDGDLRRCPVWTAFVTHQSQRSHPAWLSRRGRRRVLLSDVQLYVFCADYRQETMRRHSSKGGGGVGAFELNFQSEEAAARFKEVFDPFMSVASSEATGAEGGGGGGGGGEGGGG